MVVVTKESFIFKEISKEELELHKSELSGLCQIGSKGDDFVLKFKSADKDKIENIFSNNHKLLKSIK